MRISAPFVSPRVCLCVSFFNRQEFLFSKLFLSVLFLSSFFCELCYVYLRLALQSSVLLLIAFYENKWPDKYKGICCFVTPKNSAQPLHWVRMYGQVGTFSESSLRFVFLCFSFFAVWTQRYAIALCWVAPKHWINSSSSSGSATVATGISSNKPLAMIVIMQLVTNATKWKIKSSVLTISFHYYFIIYLFTVFFLQLFKWMILRGMDWICLYCIMYIKIAGLQWCYTAIYS